MPGEAARDLLRHAAGRLAPQHFHIHIKALGQATGLSRKNEDRRSRASRAEASASESDHDWERGVSSPGWPMVHVETVSPETVSALCVTSAVSYVRQPRIGKLMAPIAMSIGSSVGLPGESVREVDAPEWVTSAKLPRFSSGMACKGSA